MTRHQDPLDELSHDHGHLSTLVIVVRSALPRTGPTDFDELDDAVDSLREALLAHFAREEEGFFPFVESHVPTLRPSVDALRADHDRVCERLADLSRVVRQGTHHGGGVASCVSSFERFEELYAKHAQAELAFLKEVDALSDTDARAQLRNILAAI